MASKQNGKASDPSEAIKEELGLLVDALFEGIEKRDKYLAQLRELGVDPKIISEELGRVRF